MQRFAVLAVLVFACAGPTRAPEPADGGTGVVEQSTDGGAAQAPDGEHEAKSGEVGAAVAADASAADAASDANAVSAASDASAAVAAADASAVGEASSSVDGASRDAGTSEGEPLPCVDSLRLPLLPEAPLTLAGTGLYRDGATDPRDFAPHARPFQPQFELWSDGATKQRFVYLPACTQVDTSEMDYWKFPVGTRLWKEFRKDGTLLETRFIHRFGPRDEDWLFATYQWDLSRLTPEAALKVEDGARNINGTQHDVPSTQQCRSCHVNLPEPPLAFSALQLSHSLPGETLLGLRDAGRLSVAPAGNYTPPGDDTARAALGYLHANCGHCHNSYYRTLGNSLPNDPAPRMRLSVHDRTVERTTTYRTLVAVGTFNPSYEGYNRIEPCNPQVSSVLLRMTTRSDEQMPPLGTEVVHEAGIDLVSRFLKTLHAPGVGACPGSAPSAEP